MKKVMQMMKGPKGLSRMKQMAKQVEAMKNQKR
jgi:hypothetical protein